MPLYTRFKQIQLGDGTDTPVNFKNDTIKVALVTSSYTPDANSHNFFSDITGEASGTGYTAGGSVLSGVSVVKDTANGRGYVTATDATWPSSTITARYAVIYKDTGSAATSPLIGYIDFGADKSTSGDTFYIQWTAAASGGVLNLS